MLLKQYEANLRQAQQPKKLKNMKILTIAWKNIWRNKLRSSIVIGAITIGIMSGTFAVAIMLGMIGQRVDDAINIEAGHIQIHHPKFETNYEAQYTITDYKQKIEEIRAMPEVKAVVSHSKAMAIFQKQSESSASLVIGINPEEEKKVSVVHEKIWDSVGDYFETERNKPILISKKNALQLKVERYVIDSVSWKVLEKKIPANVLAKIEQEGKFKNKLHLYKYLRDSLTQDELDTYKEDFYNATESFNIRNKPIVVNTVSKDTVSYSPVYKTVGIYKTSNGMYDQLYSFVLDEDLRESLHINEDETHEIVILLHDIEMVDAVKAKLESMYPDLKIEDWKELRPDAGMAADMMSIYGIIFMTIILLALAFGIVNTMLMVVLERIKELGMLMAIGMNKLRVFMMIMSETIMLCLVGAVLGMTIGYFLIQGFSSGIDISSVGEGMEAVGYASTLYPKLDPVFFIEVTGLTLLTGILAAIYPARKAIKLNPAEAVRSDV